MTIEFFYSRFKLVVIYGLVPINLLQAVCFFAAINFNELKYVHVIAEDQDMECMSAFLRGETCPMVFSWSKSDDYEFWIEFFSLMNLVMTFIQLIISFFQLKGIGQRFFMRFFSYVEMTFIILNAIMSWFQLKH